MVDSMVRKIVMSLEGMDSGFSRRSKMELYCVVFCAHASIFSRGVMVFFVVEDVEEDSKWWYWSGLLPCSMHCSFSKWWNA